MQNCICLCIAVLLLHFFHFFKIKFHILHCQTVTIMQRVSVHNKKLEMHQTPSDPNAQICSPCWRNVCKRQECAHARDHWQAIECSRVASQPGPYFAPSTDQSRTRITTATTHTHTTAFWMPWCNEELRACMLLRASTRLQENREKRGNWMI